MVHKKLCYKKTKKYDAIAEIMPMNVPVISWFFVWTPNSFLLQAIGIDRIVNNRKCHPRNRDKRTIGAKNPPM